MATAVGADFAASPRPDGLIYTADVVADPVQDWIRRSTAPGVRLAENFDYVDLAQAELASWFLFKNVSPPNSVASIEAEHGLSGKALRLEMTAFAGDRAGGTWALDPDGTGLRNGYSRLYVQIVVWGDNQFNYAFKENDDGDASPKVCILDYGTQGSQDGEIVIQNQRSYGVVNSYRRTAAGQNNIFTRTDPSYPNDPSARFWQPALDNGTPATPVTWQDYDARYGPIFPLAVGNQSLRTGGLEVTDLLSNQGTPNPEHRGVNWFRGDWTVVTFFSDTSTDHVMVWASRYGDAPKTLIDQQPADLPAVLYDRLNLLTFITSAAVPHANMPTPMYLDYCEVLTSTAPINFPGDFPLPGNPG